MSTQTYSNNKRIAKNTLFLYFRMLLIMGVQLYTSRVVLRVLGVEDYGIYNIVGGIVVLFSFINGSMASATQRFLNYELGAGTTESVKRIFSMSLTTHILVALVMVVLAETVGLWFLNTQLNIPAARMGVANWVYQFSILTTCVSIIQVPYYASIVSYEKMSFFAYIAVFEAVLKLTVITILIYVGVDKLKIYAVLIFCVSILTFLIYKYYCGSKIPSAKYTLFWDKDLFRKLIAFSGWMLLGSAASVSSTQGVNFVLNMFCGVVVNAAMGICNNVNAAINGFVSNFQTAYMPQIVKLYAVGDIMALRKLLNQSSRFSFLLLFALACPIMMNIDFILNLWLGTFPAYTSIFCILILIYSLIDAMSKPVGLAIHATGNVKNYNIVMSLALSLNVILSYFFLKTGFMPYIVMVVNIFVGCICAIIRLLLARKYGVLKVTEYIKEVYVRIILVTVLVIPIPLCISIIMDKWCGLLSSSFVFFLLFGCGTYFVALKKNEREIIKKIIEKKLEVHG